MNDVDPNRQPTQYSIGCLLAVTTLLALPVAFISCVDHRNRAWQAEVERRRRQDVETVKQVVIDVEAVCKQLGRAPQDQKELESLMGKPLPNVHDNGYPTPIFYSKTGETTFSLVYELWATDDWVYDSANPEAGWVQHWY